jgi:hypothetical protein
LPIFAEAFVRPQECQRHALALPNFHGQAKY